jgi:hypothetical protein
VFLVTIMLVDTFTEFTIHIHHNVIHLTWKEEQERFTIDCERWS